MSGEPMVSRGSAEILRRRAGNLNALAFGLLAVAMLAVALSSAWSGGDRAVDVIWWAAAAGAAASGGLAAAVGGAVLNAIAASQDADRHSPDPSE